MTKLFSENLGTASNKMQLDELKKKFRYYDPLYIAVSTMTTRLDFRSWLESIWVLYEPYADSNFLIEFKTRFAERSWELYLGVTLLNHSHKLDTSNNIGPDFKAFRNNKSTWIEATVTTPGKGNDKVPRIKYGVAMDVPEEQMLLRLTSAIKEKSDKYNSYIKKGIIKTAEPYVIAINRSNLEHLDPGTPLIFKCLFGIGYQTLFIKAGTKRYKTTGSNWTARASIKKLNESQVSMLFFQNPEFAGVSAIIYCTDNILNSPMEPKDMGKNFVIVHNPLAKNPFPYGFFKFGDEWSLQEGHLKKH